MPLFRTDSDFAKINAEEEERKRREESYKIVLIDALTKIKNATDNETLDTNQANKMVQDMLTGKFTGLTPEVGGDFQPTGFLPNDPALAGIPPERMRVNPATGKLEMGMNKPKPIDYSSPDTYKLVDGKLTRVGEGKVNVLREPAPRETPDEAALKAGATQHARNQANLKDGVGRTGSTASKETPEEKSNRKWAENLRKPENWSTASPQDKEDAAEILNLEKVVTPGAKKTWKFGSDDPDTIDYRPRASGTGQPAPALATTQKNPASKEYPDAFFENGKWKVIRDGKKFAITEKK